MGQKNVPWTMGAILLQDVGGQFSVKSMKSSGRCRSNVLQIQISNLVYRGVLKVRLITLIHQLGFIRTVSWSAQNDESHWSQVHITLTVEHFSFHAIYKRCGLQHDLMSCLSRLILQRR